jgi:hypothetical protein
MGVLCGSRFVKGGGNNKAPRRGGQWKWIREPLTAGDRCKAFQRLMFSGFEVGQFRRDGEFDLGCNMETEVCSVSEQDAGLISGAEWREFSCFHHPGRDFRKVRLCASLEVSSSACPGAQPAARPYWFQYQYVQLWCDRGNRLSSSLQLRHCGKNWSINDLKRSLWCRSMRCTSS